MPNYTSNKLIIYGSKENIDRLFNSAKQFEGGDKPFSFESWFPQPQTYKDYDTCNHPNGEGLVIGNEFNPVNGDKCGKCTITQELIDEYKEATKLQKEKYGVVGWYDYNRQYYGCKWIAWFNLTRISDTEAETDVFDTPWTSPQEFVFRLANEYHLEIEMYSHYEDNANTCCSFFYDEEEGLSETGEEDCGDFAEAIREILEANIDNLEHEDKKRARRLIDTYIDDDYWDICYNYDTKDVDNILAEFDSFLDWYEDEDDEEEDENEEAEE